MDWGKSYIFLDRENEKWDFAKDQSEEENMYSLWPLQTKNTILKIKLGGLRFTWAKE